MAAQFFFNTEDAEVKAATLLTAYFFSTWKCEIRSRKGSSVNTPPIIIAKRMNGSTI
jgi:hypothetical protein